MAVFALNYFKYIQSKEFLEVLSPKSDLYSPYTECYNETKKYISDFISNHPELFI